jgi:hypothetical protein
MQSVRSCRDAAKTLDVADVDQLGWGNNVFLHQVEQINAAGLDHGAVAQLAQGFVYRPGIDKCELVHACTSSCVLPNAASTLAGVIGSFRIRTPVAL